MSEKIIRVTCEVADFLPVDQIMEFQGELKKRDRYDIENIKRSLKKYGINYPFYIWEHEGVMYCLNGHGRKIALVELRDKGWTVPDIPIVYILAKDMAEAKEKVLLELCRFGKMTEESVKDFIGDMPVELDEIQIPSTENIEFAAIPKDLDSVFTPGGTEKKEKRRKTCPYCGGLL